MFVVLSDTHGRNGHRLAGRALEAVSEAERVLHAGDFVTERVLDAFQGIGPELHAVHGNVDGPRVRERLPAARTVDLAGVKVAMAHGHEHAGTTGLTLFGRGRAADLVVFGHSHVPGVQRAGEVTLLNPGSHADPRGNPASHAELEPTSAAGLRGRLCERDGSVLETFTVEPSRD